VGKREVMSAAQESFISSTFWTERVGFVAGLKTVEILLRDRVWEHLIKIGTAIGEGWLRLGKKHGLKLEVTEYKPLISMKLGYGDENPAIVTLFIQEMLKRGYLAAASVYVSHAHTMRIVEDYLKAADDVFDLLAKAITSNTVKSKLETRVKSETFKRLN
jgi:glutamate-1-semialdehyde 2,1-aminomutase